MEPSKPTQKDLACGYCEERFSTNQKFSEHVRRHEKGLVCPLCNKTFPRPYRLKVHVLKYADERPYTCAVCNRGFHSKVKLNLHIFVHSGRPVDACNICGKQFLHKFSLERHLLIHSGTKAYRCHICEKKFSQRGNLNKHIMRHDGIKPYVCDLCDKHFSQKDHLNMHRFVHIGGDSRACNICGEEFSEKSCFDKHLQMCKRHRKTSTVALKKLPKKNTACDGATASHAGIDHTGNDYSSSGSNEVSESCEPKNTKENGLAVGQLKCKKRKTSATRRKLPTKNTTSDGATAIHADIDHTGNDSSTSGSNEVSQNCEPKNTKENGFAEGQLKCKKRKTSMASKKLLKKNTTCDRATSHADIDHTRNDSSSSGSNEVSQSCEPKNTKENSLDEGQLKCKKHQIITASKKLPKNYTKGGGSTDSHADIEHTRSDSSSSGSNEVSLSRHLNNTKESHFAEDQPLRFIKLSASDLLPREVVQQITCETSDDSKPSAIEEALHNQRNLSVSNKVESLENVFTQQSISSGLSHTAEVLFRDHSLLKKFMTPGSSDDFSEELDATASFPFGCSILVYNLTR